MYGVCFQETASTESYTEWCVGSVRWVEEPALHAARLGDKLSSDRVIVPKGAGVGSAVGFLMAPIGYEVVRTRLVDLRDFDPEYVNGIFADMRQEAEDVVRLGAPDAELVEIRTAYMRYR